LPDAALGRPEPIGWRPESVARLGEATGIGRARAALLIAMPPGVLDWSTQFLTAEQLARYELKAAQAKAAREWLRALDDADRTAVRAALLPAAPAELWDSGPAVDAAARVWIERRGRLVTLSEEAQARTTGTRIKAVEEVLNPGRVPWLARRTGYTVQVDGEVRRLAAADPLAVPSGWDLLGAVGALRWLAHQLPYGHELRPLLPVALTALRDRVADPELLVGLDLYSSVQGRPLAALVRASQGLPEAAPAGGDLLPVGEALLLAPGNHGECVYLRPAALAGAADPVIDQLLAMVAGYPSEHLLLALRALADDALTRLVADGAEATDGRPQDPRRSAPDLVAEVAGARSLSADAAALYLQLLALPDPTDRNTADWLGLKPARLKQVRAELAASGLVVEAKRPRAGRSLFLPGGWQEIKAPGLPVESWKAGLYELPASRAILPELPVGELFAKAWQRIIEGDQPGYEQLVTNTRRRGRR
jgi:hypothetical protein